MIERWKEARRLLEDLMDLSQEAQEARLRETESQDPHLAQVVRGLLQRDQELRPQGDGTGAPWESHDPSVPSPSSRRRVGRYRLRHRIATGRVASVWWAARADGAFDQDVAIKLIDTARVAQDLGVTREEAVGHERRLLARVESPRVVRLLDAGELDKVTEWLALELLDAEPIVAYCNRQKLGIRERMSLMAQAAKGVSDCHGAGVLHLDLSPTNVLVTSAGTVKIIDFGSARREDQASTAAGSAATPAYAAPESFRDGSIASPLNDVWSLGALCYELLCGSPPIETDAVSMAEARRRRLEEDPLPPSRRLKGTDSEDAQGLAAARGTSVRSLTQELRSGGLEAVVLAALRRDQERRTRSPVDLEEDLHRWLRGEPVVARRETLTERITRLARRRPKVALAAGAVGASLILGGTTFWSGAREARAAALEVAHFQEIERERLRSTRTAARVLVDDLFEAIAPVPGSLPSIAKLLDASIELAESAPDEELGVTLADALVKRAAFSTEAPRWTPEIAHRALADCDRAEALVRNTRELHPGRYDPARVEWTASLLRGICHFELCDMEACRAALGNALTVVDGYSPPASDPLLLMEHSMAKVLVRTIRDGLESEHGRLEVALGGALESLQIAEEAVALAPHVSINVETRIFELRIRIASLTYASQFQSDEPVTPEGESLLEGALAQFGEMIATMKRNGIKEQVLATGSNAALELSSWLTDLGRVEESDRVLRAMGNLVAEPGVGAARRQPLRAAAVQLGMDVGAANLETLLRPGLAASGYLLRADRAMREGDWLEVLRLASRAASLIENGPRACPDRVSTQAWIAHAATLQGRATEELADSALVSERLSILKRAEAHFQEAVTIVDGMDAGPLFMNRLAARQAAVHKDLERCRAKLR